MIRFETPDPNKARENRTKHEGVTFTEGESVFLDEGAIELIDSESDPTEERLVWIGMSEKARVLVVVYTLRHEAIRIISARPATPTEREEYSSE